MDVVADKIIKGMIDNKIIQVEDKAIYQYGLYHAMVVGFNVGTSFIIGMITGKLGVVVTFLLFYSVLRSYSGGFHFNNKYLCYIFSNIILCIPIFTMELVGQIVSENFRLISLTIAVIIILILSPVDSVKKRLDDAEIEHHSVIAKTILGIEICFIITLYSLKMYNLVYAGYSAIILISVFMILGFIQNATNHDS